MASLNDAWEQLARRIPAQASARQRREMELAFYSGASAFASIAEALLDSPDEPSRTRLASSVSKEVEGFRTRMLADILNSIFTKSQPTRKSNRYN